VRPDTPVENNRSVERIRSTTAPPPHSRVAAAACSVDERKKLIHRLCVIRQPFDPYFAASS
jgi:hypothetical protein